MAEAHQEWIRADPLQRFHSLHNLAELVSSTPGGAPASLPPGVPRTLRDDRLAVEAAVISQVIPCKPSAMLTAAGQPGEPQVPSRFAAVV